MFFAAYRRAIRERRKVEADRDFWKQRALALETKLDSRTDFYIEREFKLVDRVLTKNGAYAITDQIRGEASAKAIDESDVKSAAKEAYIESQRDWFIQCARDAGLDDPVRAGTTKLSEMMSMIESDFEANYRLQITNN